MMQPLLLIKQTMDEAYDSGGSLILNGPHLQATSAEELISSLLKNGEDMSVKITGQNLTGMYTDKIRMTYRIDNDRWILKEQESVFKDIAKSRTIKLALTSTDEEIRNQLDGSFELSMLKSYGESIEAAFVNSSAFLDYQARKGGQIVFRLPMAKVPEQAIAGLIHLPGLRGAPQRSYPTAFFGRRVKGTFEPYTASVIHHWQKENDKLATNALAEALQNLGLTNSVVTQQIDANSIAVKVSRIPTSSKSKKDDLVNIADVGFGVSQVLPIVVALIAAEPGQIVYIEQPELHLHPKAQVAMAHLLADAAKRGVRVIAETHSSLILLTVQTLVAEGKLTPEEVGLHWFERDAKGATKVTLAEVDENGSYGEWPADFGDIELKAHGDYLDAVVDRNIKKAQ